MNLYQISIDDIDSDRGGCTTYTLVKIIASLKRNDSRFKILGFPRLVRLNPNVPYKTRGNGALYVKFESLLTQDIILSIAKNVIEEDIKNYGEKSQSQPTLIIASGEIQPNERYYNDSLTKFLLNVDDSLIQKNYLIWPNKKNRSLVGTLAALHANFSDDCSYELLVYRTPAQYGKTRIIDQKQLKSLQSEFKDSLFSNYDPIEERELIAPSGSDPIYFGLRGENPDLLKKIMSQLKLNEKIQSSMIFQSNQGTGIHLEHVNNDLQEFSVFSSLIMIRTEPLSHKGGYVTFRGWDQYSNNSLKFIAFEPTKTFPKLFSNLIPGDLIMIHGSVKPSTSENTISVDEVCIIKLVDKMILSAPYCPNCKHRTTKAGWKKGYKCKTCSFATRNPNVLNEPRENVPLGHYLPVKSAQRHLTRPREREYRRNKFEGYKARG